MGVWCGIYDDLNYCIFTLSETAGIDHTLKHQSLFYKIYTVSHWLCKHIRKEVTDKISQKEKNGSWYCAEFVTLRTFEMDNTVSMELLITHLMISWELCILWD